MILYLQFVLHQNDCCFSLGKLVGGWPFVTILIAILVAALCGVGMIKFIQESRGEKLWNPQDSEALAHKDIVAQRYPVASRLTAALFESSNVLQSQVVRAVSINLLFLN